MHGRPRWRRYLGSADRDLGAGVDDELRFHFEMRVEELLAAGLTEEEARAEAERRMGDLAEVGRRMRTFGRRARRKRRRRERLARLWTDAKRSLRGFRRSPGFALAALATLALGIGATTAVFALLEGVVLRPLPYPDPERLVVVRHPVPGVSEDAEWGLSVAGYRYFREESETLGELGAWFPIAVTLSGDAPAVRVDGALATHSLPAALEASVALGRSMTSADARPGAPPVAWLSHGLWRDRFGADPSILGRTLRVDERPYTVAGVFEAGFDLPERDVDVWLPLEIDPEAPAVNSHFLHAIGRLRSGASPEAAASELQVLTARLPEVFPRAYDEAFLRDSRFTVRVAPLRAEVAGSAAEALWILLAAVSLLLIVAAANVAGLFVVRAEARRRELAVRSALGAGRGDLAGHLLAESLVLAAAAAALGVWLAGGGIALVRELAPAGIPRLDGVEIGWRAVLLAGGIAGVAGLAFGAFPVLRRPLDLAALREGGRRSSASRRRLAVRHALVAGQVALALTLLAGAGLLIETFRNLRGVDPGVRTEGVLAFDVSLPAAKYATHADVSRFAEDLLARIESLPGVRRAAAGEYLPIRDEGRCAFLTVEGREAASDGGTPPCPTVALVSPGWFETLGIPVRGRAPDWSDTNDPEAGRVVVTPSLARLLWPGGDPIGQGLRDGGGVAFYRVAGVTGEIRGRGVDRPPIAAVFFPLRPIRGRGLWVPPRDLTVVVRGAAPATSLVPALRRAVGGVDPDVPVAGVRTMADVLAASMARVSFTLALLLVAAGMAVVLSAVGLYGVVAYVVRLRRPEIGIRMALGASTGRIARMVLGRALRLAAAGIAAGIVLAIALTRMLGSLLYGVEPADVGVLAIVSTLLLGVTGLAAFGPARRATAVDLAEALRAE